MTTQFETVKPLVEQDKSSGEIANLTGIKVKRVYYIRTLIRSGFNSEGEYKNWFARRQGLRSASAYNEHLAKQKGYKSVQRRSMDLHGFDRAIDLLNYNAIRMGFEGQAHYQIIRRKIKRDNVLRQIGAQRKFEGEIEFHDPKEIEKLAKTKKIFPVKENLEEKIKEVLEIIDLLSERDREVVKRAYLKGETQKQIAKEYGVSNRAVNERLLRAIYRVRRFYLCGTPINTPLPKDIDKIARKPRKKIEDGELLLAHIIIRGREISSQQRYRPDEKPNYNLVNELFHEGIKVRKGRLIYGWVYSIKNTPSIRKRLTELKAKYFPYHSKVK